MRKLSVIGAGLVLSLVLIGIVLPVFAQSGGDPGEQEYAGTVPAVPFPEGLDWINTPGALTWEDLRGKVVLLDFWTYGCINCIHIIPDLKRLEAEYPEALVVIGVHSAKFANEGDTENIRQIVQRYEVEHPVVNDRDFAIWNAWGVRAWPTVMLVDPLGNVFGYHAGEGVYPVLQPIIDGMVREFDDLGLIDRAPIELELETDNRPESLLAFPGKVLADEAGQRLFIADTNHNRIVVTDLSTYEVMAVIGGLSAGDMDGGYAVTRFSKPQGMALNDEGSILYVADTGNHTLRAVDLIAETVTTVAGTGSQARYQAAGGIGTDAALSSPWDLTYVDGILYIAMAGPHQLWSYDTATHEVRVHSGSGREGVVDGSHASAELAQPSGISSDGVVLYFADSEASAIRVSDLDPAGGVTTLVGTGLFDFGDRDGVASEALLQHPLGVVVADDVLLIADTYNSKIRQIDLETGEVRTVTGNSSGGYLDGALSEALFDEPGGLSLAGRQLYVADTNNHAIRVVDLDAHVVSTVQFPNPDVLQAGREAVVAAAPFSGNEVLMDAQSVQAGQGQLVLGFEIPAGYKLNDIAISLIDWHVDGIVVLIAEDASQTVLTDLETPVTVAAEFGEGSAEVVADLTLYYCEAVNETLCFVDRARLNLPLNVTTASEGVTINLLYQIIPPTLE